MGHSEAGAESSDDGVRSVSDSAVWPGTRWASTGDGVPLLWSDHTGRGWRLAPGRLDTVVLQAAQVPVLAQRLADLGRGGPPLVDRVVCRTHWCLLLPERPALWHARPLERGAGGLPWQLAELDDEAWAIHQAVNNRRTVRDIAHQCGILVEQVLRELQRFTTLSTQVIQLRLTPLRPHDRSLHRLECPPRPPHGDRVSAAARTAQGATALGEWHETAIQDAATHFDNVETTLAHALARPHAALGGQTYGARWRDRLVDLDLLTVGATVLEVGPGTGELAASVLEQDRGRCIHRYLRVDRSPVLLAAQAKQAPDTEGIHGDATALPLEEQTVDVVMSSEVVADLPAVPWQPTDLEDHHGVGIWVQRADLRVLPGRGPYNLGAWKLVSEAARVLRPGGALVLTEFGSPDEVPTETTQLDHPEVSIHFGHLAAVAQDVGLKPHLMELADFLDIDLNARWLSRASYEGLRALHTAHGAHLKARAWTVQTAPVPEPVQGLIDVPIHQDGPAPVPTRIWVLVARKPGD